MPRRPNLTPMYIATTRINASIRLFKKTTLGFPMAFNTEGKIGLMDKNGEMMHRKINGVVACVQCGPSIRGKASAPTLAIPQNKGNATKDTASIVLSKVDLIRFTSS